MAIRKILSVKKVPAKKTVSKSTFLGKARTAKGRAKKAPIKKKTKVIKTNAVKGKPRKEVSSRMDSTRSMPMQALVNKPTGKKVALPKGGTTKKSSHRKVATAKAKIVGTRAATKLNHGKKAMAVPKAVAKSVGSKPASRIALVEKKIAGIRNEFKKALKTEVSAAFDVCLAAMENAANLMEARLVTVLGEMSNLVSGAKPDFKDGKLKSVVSEDGKERTDFSYGNNGLVTSRTYRDGKLKFEIIHGKLGNPLSGRMFDSSGNVAKEFSYGPDGQVK